MIRTALVRALGAALLAALFASPLAARTQGEKPAQRTEAQGAQAANLGASNVIGMNVLGPERQKLGEVRDFVIDTRRRSVSYVVLAHGGVLGFGDSLFPYPLNAFNLDDKGRLILNVPRERVEGSPGYKAGEWARVRGDAGFWSNLDQRFATGPMAGQDRGSPPPGGGRDEQRLMRATDVLGKQVLNARGAPLGKLADLVIDMRSGAVHHAVITVPNSSRSAQAPMDRLDVTTEGNGVVVRYRGEQLDAALAIPAALAAFVQADSGDKASPGATSSVKMQSGDTRAERIIGADVKNPSGEKLGHVKDLVIDTRNGQIAYVVLARGGVLGAGQDMYPYPLQSFRVGRELTLNVSKQDLEKSRGFSDGDWPRVRNDRGFWSQLDERYGIGARDPKRHGHEGVGDAGYFVRASELLDNEVTSANGTRVAKVDDLVVDLSQARVRYAVLDMVRGPKIAVEMSQLEAQPTGVNTIIRAKGERLDTSRLIDEQQWREQSKSR